MLKHLMFSVDFPATGKSFSGQHSFPTGLTAITGANERGKSLRLEFVRYGLFGTKALRASASNYKNLKVELSFSANGTDYTVVRNKSKAYIQSAGKTLANGGTATNRKIYEIFGFDLRVFDVTNACPQGEVEALGNMRPAERKSLVDQTVGLTTIDRAVERLKELANAEKRSAEAIEGTLQEPLPPVAPPDYTPSDVLEQDLPELQSKADELQRVLGWLSAGGPAEPVYPDCPVSDTVEDLQAHQDERKKILAHKQQLENAIAEIPPTEDTMEHVEQLEDLFDKHDRWKRKQEIDRLYPAPSHPESELRSMAKAWETINYIDSLHKDIARLEEQGEHTCTSCGNTEPLQQEKIAELKAEMPSERPEDPALSEAEVNRQLQRAETYKQRPTDYDDAVEVDVRGLDRASVRERRKAVERADERKRLEEQLAALTVPEDRSEDLKARQRYEEAVRDYDRRKAEYDAYVEERRRHEARAAELHGADVKLKQLNEKLSRAKAYEVDYSHYVQAKQKHDDQLAQANQHRHQQEQYQKAREALKDLKARIKQHLVPSLSRVASHLLTQMTNGSRRSIKIDADFEITVDGQPLSTLSGSGKAVTNLAIRIALGQVLTNRVLSSFLGDEIDAAMDEERANYTADCLRNLKDNVSQIILITHKSPDADKIIEV